MHNTRIYHDRDTGIDAYEICGVSQKFPPHFHSYYVIGLLKSGKRSLICKGKEYTMLRGDILLLNPGDIHSCVQNGSSAMDYTALNIPACLPPFKNVIFSYPLITDQAASKNTAADITEELCRAVICNAEAPIKRALLGRLFAVLAPGCTCALKTKENTESTAVIAACEYIREHFSENLTISQICAASFTSRASLIRAFAAEKGISPHKYLKNIRLCHAQRLLENGVSPAGAAADSGFSDQSHFSNMFKEHTGFTPSVYRRIFFEKRHKE